LHRIKVWLYPNYMESKIPGKYVGRTASEKTLTIEDVCASLKDRDGAIGDPAEAAALVHRFFEEAIRLLCDGFGISVGWFLMYAKVGGMFNKKTEGITDEDHPITFHFRILKMLRDIGKLIKVEVLGVAETGGYIDEFIDIESGAVNETYKPGGMFSVTGHKIKVAGEGTKVGVFMVSPGSPTVSVRVMTKLAENTAGKIIGIMPDLPAGRTWRIEVRTLYAGSSSTPLKEVRIITSDFTLTQETATAAETAETRETAETANNK
jgi:hypothetical protein